MLGGIFWHDHPKMVKFEKIPNPVKRIIDVDLKSNVDFQTILAKFPRQRAKDTKQRPLHRRYLFNRKNYKVSKVNIYKFLFLTISPRDFRPALDA